MQLNNPLVFLWLVYMWFCVVFYDSCSTWHYDQRTWERELAAACVFSFFHFLCVRPLGAEGRLCSLIIALPEIFPLVSF